MSHVFISYKSEDQFQLQALVDVLKKADIPYWYDVGIRAGDDWRDEIDANLDDSFAMIILVTDRSAESQYVIYEWSRAIGQGIPLIPLLFQRALPINLHPRLRTLEHIACYPEIPIETLIQTVKLRKEKSYLVRLVESAIAGLVWPLRLAVHSLSLFDSIYRIKIARPNLHLVSNLVDEIYDLVMLTNTKTMSEFWIASSHALSRGQKKIYEKLAQKLEELPETLGRLKYELHIDPLSYDSEENMSRYRLEEVLAQWMQIERILEDLASAYDTPYYMLSALKQATKIAKQGNDDNERTLLRVLVGLEHLPPPLPDSLAMEISKLSNDIIQYLTEVQ